MAMGTRTYYTSTIKVVSKYVIARLLQTFNFFVFTFANSSKRGEKICKKCHRTLESDFVNLCTNRGASVRMSITFLHRLLISILFFTFLHQLHMCVIVVGIHTSTYIYNFHAYEYLPSTYIIG